METEKFIFKNKPKKYQEFFKESEEYKTVTKLEVPGTNDFIIYGLENPQRYLAFGYPLFVKGTEVSIKEMEKEIYKYSKVHIHAKISKQKEKISKLKDSLKSIKTLENKINEEIE